MNSKIAVTALTALLSSSVLTGCGDSGVIHDYQGIDASGSWTPYLSASAQLSAATVRCLDPDTDWVTVYRVDDHCHEFFNGPAPDDGDAFQQTLVAEIKNHPDHSGTFPAVFFNTVAARVSNEPGGRKVLVDYYSDADNDDADSDPAMRAAARSLAADSDIVAVTFYGANPTRWAVLRSEFAPLGDRLHLIAPPGLSLDAVHDTLDKVSR